MTLIVIIIAGVLLLGIVFLKSQTPSRRIDREDFLSKIEDYTEGERQSTDGLDGSYKVNFTFEEKKYSFEDIFIAGFKGEVRRVHLKCFMDNDFSLNFTEKQTGSTVRLDMLMVSDIPDKVIDTGNKIDVPKVFDEFIVQTNNASVANKLLSDKKVISVLMGYKNTDDRGRPFFSLKIISGVITLHFHMSSILKPSLSALQGEIATLENHIDKVMVIANRLKD